MNPFFLFESFHFESFLFPFQREEYKRLSLSFDPLMSEMRMKNLHPVHRRLPRAIFIEFFQKFDVMKCTAGFIGTLVVRTYCHKLDLVQRWKTHLRHVTNVESETFEPFFLHGAHNEYLSSIMQTCSKNSSDVQEIP